MHTIPGIDALRRSPNPPESGTRHPVGVALLNVRMDQREVEKQLYRNCHSRASVQFAPARPCTEQGHSATNARLRFAMRHLTKLINPPQVIRHHLVERKITSFHERLQRRL